MCAHETRRLFESPQQNDANNHSFPSPTSLPSASVRSFFWPLTAESAAHKMCARDARATLESHVRRCLRRCSVPSLRRTGCCWCRSLILPSRRGATWKKNSPLLLFMFTCDASVVMRALCSGRGDRFYLAAFPQRAPPPAAPFLQFKLQLSGRLFAAHRGALTDLR